MPEGDAGWALQWWSWPVRRPLPSLLLLEEEKMMRFLTPESREEKNKKHLS